MFPTETPNIQMVLLPFSLLHSPQPASSWMHIFTCASSPSSFRHWRRLTAKLSWREGGKVNTDCTMSLNDMAPWIVVKFPWIPVLFLVPLCIVYDLYCYVRLRVRATARTVPLQDRDLTLCVN